MKQHKWLSARTFIELKRAYLGGMSYKEMGYRFSMTPGQISWYIRDLPKRHPHMSKKEAKDNRPSLSPKQMAAFHAIAKKSLKQEIEQAKKERATAPLYRPAPEKVW